MRVFFYASVSEVDTRWPLTTSPRPPGQGGQQLVTQIIRGQTVTTTAGGASPGTTVTGQRLASPAAPGQTAAGTPRPQQGQFKLTLTQLSQLAQVSVSVN